jgi:hypothetical protein
MIRPLNAEELNSLSCFNHFGQPLLSLIPGMIEVRRARQTGSA